MATTKNLEDHNWVLERLQAAQKADHDMREQARQAHLFVDKRDGQWEPYVWEQAEGRPRYTFDFTNPLIDQIAGDMEKMDFDIGVQPAGSDASKDVAATFDGMVRNIENISNATKIYNSAGRNMVTAGIDGWRVKQKYVDSDSFDQDLVVERVGNWVDRVWFGPHEEPDASDAEFGWILTGVDPGEFKERYPERAAEGVDTDRTGTAYFYRPDLVMVGEFLYVQPEERELVLMSNGTVLEADEKFAKIADELMQAGVLEERRRKRTKYCVYSRLFDTRYWITEPRKTVFQNWIPLIPCYANFKLFEDKVTYWGAVEKVLDPQRVFNYSKSREIEEGALAPRAKYWMTEDQAAGHEAELATMNTNADPVQIYNFDANVPGPPQQQGGALINPGLTAVSESMRGMIGEVAGMFAANRGDNPGLQSGVAIERLQDKGDTGTNKYTEAREIAQLHTGRILVNTIPRVYSPGRQTRILNQDGSIEMVTLGEKIFDEQSQEEVTVNDLSKGTYDVTVSSGPSYKNRQSETVAGLTEVGKVDPTVIEMGGDILLNNMASPGMDQLAARKRQQLFQAGMIPEEQMTDEEKQQISEAQNQEPQEDPNMVLAKAEEGKAQAQMTKAQTDQFTAQANAENAATKNKIDLVNAETNRIKADTEKTKVNAEIKGIAAKASKDLADAEAQDIENDAVQSGVMDLVENIQGG